MIAEIVFWRHCRGLLWSAVDASMHHGCVIAAAAVLLLLLLVVVMPLLTSLLTQALLGKNEAVN
jgi:hypothetical protein